MNQLADKYKFAKQSYKKMLEAYRVRGIDLEKSTDSFNLSTLYNLQNYWFNKFMKEK